jgi:hypothetical protein
MLFLRLAAPISVGGNLLKGISGCSKIAITAEDLVVCKSDGKESLPLE